MKIILMKNEDVFWQKAWDLIHERYGKELPDEFEDRLRTEQELFSGTGMIRHLNLISRLEEHGIYRDWQNPKSPSLIAWLYHVTPINPLPPHTWCPHCHRIEMHPEVKDGWDLPEMQCSCGAMMNRDGHGIPLMRYQKNFFVNKRFLDLNIADADMDALKQIISREYDDRWKLIPYRFISDYDTNSDYFNQLGDHYLLAPSKQSYEFSADEDGTLLIPVSEFSEHFIHSTTTILYILADAFREPGCGKIVLDSAMGEAGSIYLSPLPLHDLWERYKTVQGMIFRKPMEFSNDENWGSGVWFPSGECELVWDPQESSYSQQVVTKPDTDTDYHGNPIDVIETQYPEADLTPWLPEKPSFSAIIHLMGIQNSLERLVYALDMLQSDHLQVTDIPVCEEDMAELLSKLMDQQGIHDNHLLWNIAFPDDPLHPENGPVAQSAVLKLPEWLDNYRRQFFQDKESLTKAAMITLYKAGIQWADVMRMRFV